jgi:protease I
MGDKPLLGKKIAILVADGFEQVELTGPREALDAAGADTSILSLKPGNVRAWKFTEWGEEFPVDLCRIMSRNRRASAWRSNQITRSSA